MLAEILKTISLEGGYVNDPNDPGGETNMGLAKRWYPDLDIKNLTPDAAYEIYVRDFWQKMRCDQMPQCPLRFKIFDAGVNCGQGTSARWLQEILEVPIDGIIGSATVAIAKIVMANKDKHDAALNNFILAQINHYEAIVRANPSQARFLNGWLNRARFRGEEFNV